MSLSVEVHQYGVSARQVDCGYGHGFYSSLDIKYTQLCKQGVAGESATLEKEDTAQETIWPTMWLHYRAVASRTPAAQRSTRLVP